MSESEDKANLSQAKLGNIIWVSYNHFFKEGGAVNIYISPKVSPMLGDTNLCFCFLFWLKTGTVPVFS
jgi:hypothetical protein